MEPRELWKKQERDQFFFSFAEFNTALQLLHRLCGEKAEGATESSTAQREKVLFTHQSHTDMPHQRDH